MDLDLVFCIFDADVICTYIRDGLLQKLLKIGIFAFLQRIQQNARQADPGIGAGADLRAAENDLMTAAGHIQPGIADILPASNARGDVYVVVHKDHHRQTCGLNGAEILDILRGMRL